MKARRKTRPYRMQARAESAAQTRRQILAAAATLAAERHFDEFSLADVAAEAGVTVQTVLRRFGSKDGLLEEAAAAGSGEVRAQRFAAPKGDVAAAVHGLIEHHEAWGDTSVHFLSQAGRTPAMKKLTDGGRRLHHEWVDHVFKPWLAAERDPAARKRRRAKLAAVTDVYAWKVLRRDLGLDPAEAELAVRELVEASLR